VDYSVLAGLRLEIRRFLRASEEMVRAAGLEPQQHHLLLAMRGMPPGVEPTITEFAARLQIRHHSLVELVDRMERRQLVRRRRSERDRRKVLVDLTPEGERLLDSLAAAHRKELESAAPELLRALAELVAR
jgi:DNA-binding MarR family transcriptional regulator